MPNRTIRDAILDSERYHACSLESRLLYLELLLCADDYALVPIGDVYLRRHTTVCEGKTSEQIAGFMLPLTDKDLIRPYTSDRGGRFAFIPRFDNAPRALKPKWPLPPDGLDEGYIERMLPKSKELRIKNLRENHPTSVVRPSRETVTVTEEVLSLSHSVDTSASAAPNAAPPCPVDQIVQLWNQIVAQAGGKRVLNVSPKRRTMIACRWREVRPDTTNEGLQWFENLFRDRIAPSKFATGRQPGRDGGIFRIGIDSALASEQVVDQILEGKYA